MKRQRKKAQTEHTERLTLTTPHYITNIQPMVLYLKDKIMKRPP